MIRSIVLSAVAAVAVAVAALAPRASAQSDIDGCMGHWVFFDTGSARLDRQALEMLDGSWAGLAAMIEAGGWLRILGHADDAGPAAYNLALSRRRAEAVRRYYLRRGVPSDRLRVEAFGETRPLALPEAGEPLENARRQNRNVQIAPEMTRAVFRLFFPPGQTC